MGKGKTKELVFYVREFRMMYAATKQQLHNDLWTKNARFGCVSAKSARSKRRFGEQKLYESTSFHRKLRQISYHILLLDWMYADRAI